MALKSKGPNVPSDVHVLSSRKPPSPTSAYRGVGRRGRLHLGYIPDLVYPRASFARETTGRGVGRRGRLILAGTKRCVNCLKYLKMERFSLLHKQAVKPEPWDRKPKDYQSRCYRCMNADAHERRIQRSKICHGPTHNAGTPRVPTPRRLPLTHFSKRGNKHQSWCKKCMAWQNRINRLYLKYTKRYDFLP